MAKDIQSSEFDALIAEGVTVIDLWAPWCGPCKMIAPIFEAVSGEYAEKAKFAKVNVDESPDLATRLGVRSIPTVVLFKDGEMQEQIVGAFPKPKLTQAIDRLVG